MKTNEVMKNQPGIDWLCEKYGEPAAITFEMSDAAKMTISALVISGGKVVNTNNNRAYVQRPGGSRQSGNVLLDTGQFYCHTKSWPPFNAGEGYSPKKVLSMVGSQGKAALGRTLPMSELKQMFEAQTIWAWRSHIPKGEPSIVNGREGSGKTTICLQMAKEILDQHPDQVVIWLATEGAVKNTVKHANALGITSNRFMVAQKADGSFLFDFRLKGDIEALAAIFEATESKIAAVFIDSIRGSTGCEDNESRTGSLMHKVNAIVCDKHKASLIYIHHMRKGKKGSLLDQSVGSTAIPAAVRHVLSVVQKSKYRREIRCAKTNIDNSPVLECIKLGDRIEIFEPTQLSEESQVDRGEKLLSELFADRAEIPAYEIFRAGEKLGVFETSLKYAKKNLGIESTKIGKNWFWTLPLRGSDSSHPSNPSTPNYPKSLDREECESRVCEASEMKGVKGVKSVKGVSEKPSDPSPHPSRKNKDNNNIEKVIEASLKNPPVSVEKNIDDIVDETDEECHGCRERAA